MASWLLYAAGQHGCCSQPPVHKQRIDIRNDLANMLTPRVACDVALAASPDGVMESMSDSRCCLPLAVNTSTYKIEALKSRSRLSAHVTRPNVNCRCVY
jgi:hypothetical protein